MKKYLCMLLAAPGAIMAGEVSISGNIDSYIEAYTAGDTTNVRLSSGGSTGGSRVTFKGSEELGEGSSAFFRLEMGILNDLGISSGNRSDYLFERESLVGVRGPWGSLSFGRQYTPHFLSLPQNEAAGQTLASAISAFSVPGHASTNGIGIRGGALAATTRMDNSIVYSTPTFAGLTTTVMAAFGEQSYTDTDGNLRQSNTRGNFYNIGFRYVNGPFTSNLSVAKWNNPTVAGRMFDDVWFESFTAAYDFKITKLNVIFAARQSDDVEAPNIWAAELGSATPVAGGSFILTVGYLTNLDQDDADGLSWGVRYDYPLSKRTKIFTGIFGVQNGDNAQFVLAGGGSSTPPPAIAREEYGLDNRTVFLGINHMF